jgi:UMF1 family MFS transporter
MSDAPGLPIVGKVAPRRVWAWAAWDWATQPFNTIIVTFVFTALYLTSESFIDPEIAALGDDNPLYASAIAQLASGLVVANIVAGAIIALIAPVLGQRADARGRRKASLGVMTVLLVASVASLVFVQASPEYFLLGVSIIAFASIVAEVAGVNYNAMIVQVSTPQTMGRISGLGWGMGYLGGILALVVVVVITMLDLLPTDNGMAFRLIAVGCALWTLIFAWPLFVWVPEAPPSDRPRVSLLRGYSILWQDLKELWRSERSTLWFLLASAVYRDGLVGVFAYGGIIAAAAFGFSNENVMIFGIAASIIAGVSTIIAGRLDDRLGPRKVILTALGIIVTAGLAIVILREQGAMVFWICGLALSSMVGPAQAASRSLLARLSPEGRESEVFGLYATTGRAASFLSPVAFWIALELTDQTVWGTLGVILVVAAGFVLMLFVRTPADKPTAAASA